MGFPARVIIDDKCDSCGPGGKGQPGVAYGADKPVLCLPCLRLGLSRAEQLPGLVQVISPRTQRAQED